MRSWVRQRFPRLRAVVLAPRRALRKRRWVRRHAQVSVADRTVLSEVILPAVRAEADGADVLFVGVEWYTASYVVMFPLGNFVTIDIDDAVRTHGSPRHVTTDVRELDRHFEPGSFAAVICNGVVGYGLDQSDDVAAAMLAIARCLRSGGVLVVGWNDIDGRRVLGLERAAGGAGLVAAPGAGLPAWRSEPLGPLRHIYDVYRQP
jgi:SAM-dependent methyltransferase